MVSVDRVNSFVHIHQILDVAFMNLGNADRVVRFGVSSRRMNPLLWSSRFPLAHRSSLESYIMCGRQWNFQCTFMLNGLVLALVQSIYAYRCIKASSHVPSFPFPLLPLAPYWS